jgi:hypothetical protein
MVVKRGECQLTTLTIVVVHALKPIKEGQELITVYTDTKRPRDERRAFLSNTYNFFCECSVCALPTNESIASDERLAQMRTLKEKFATWGASAIDGKEATRLANEIWGVGEAEGYWSECVSPPPLILVTADSRLGVVSLPRMQHTSLQHTQSMFFFSLALTVPDRRLSVHATRTWAALSHKWFSIELGEDSKQATKAKTIITNPRAHAAWGTKAMMDVELPRGS